MFNTLAYPANRVRPSLQCRSSISTAGRSGPGKTIASCPACRKRREPENGQQ